MVAQLAESVRRHRLGWVGSSASPPADRRASPGRCPKTSTTVCQHPDRYASVALVAEEVWPADCPALPVLAFHGTADHVVPYGPGLDQRVGPGTGSSQMSNARHSRFVTRVTSPRSTRSERTLRSDSRTCSRLGVPGP